jgi:hypothetical protein
MLALLALVGCDGGAQTTGDGRLLTLARALQRAAAMAERNDALLGTEVVMPPPPARKPLQGSPAQD